MASRIGQWLRGVLHAVQIIVPGLERLLSSRKGWLLLLSLYGLLSLCYMVTVPVFEPPDESSHLQVIRYIRNSRRLVPYQLPIRRADSGANMAWLISYHDPPLYYAPPLYHSLGALLTWWTTMPDLPERLIPSPSWEAGYAPQRGAESWNKNVFVHLPNETLLDSPTVRAVFVLRLMSTALGGLTIWATHRLVTFLWPGAPRRALAAAAIVAFNPQFLASHSSVSNDPLVIALCSLTLLALVRLLQHRAPWYAWVGPGLLLGLGVLAKQSALLLLPLTGLATCLAPARSARNLRWRSRLLEIVLRNLAWGLPVVLMGGWWYIGQALRYGDPLGIQPHFAAQVPLQSFGLRELYYAWQSYWGAFGWTLLTTPAWFLALITGLGVMACWGLCRTIVQGVLHYRGSGSMTCGTGLLAVAVAAGLASFIGWAKQTGSPYGRLLFPTIAAQATLAAYGLTWWRSVGVRRLLLVVAVVVVLSTFLFPWMLIHPAFASPYRPGGVPKTAQPVDMECDLPVCLRGSETTSAPEGPGDTLELTLYWEAVVPVTRNLLLAVQLAGLDPTQRVAEDTRWLGGTLLPTAYWRPGDVVEHKIKLNIPSSAPAPALYWVRIAVLGPDGHPLVYGRDGSDTIVLGPWPLRRATHVPTRATPVGAWFGESIELRAFEATVEKERIKVTLYWVCKRAPARDLTVFVHLVDGDGQIVAQHDGPPAQAAYPTGWWRAGDIVLDQHDLILPEGDSSQEMLSLRVGLYEPETGQRWPAVDTQGLPLPDDAVVLMVP